MKKGKASSRQSSKRENGPRVLVPLLSKREADDAFIGAFTADAKEIILLLIIDTDAMHGEFGFAAGEIGHANALMQQVKEAVEARKKSCEDIIEWGDTETKIEHLALLKQVEKIYLVKQDNQFYKKLLKQLQEELPKVEIVSLNLGPVK